MLRRRRSPGGPCCQRTRPVFPPPFLTRRSSLSIPLCNAGGNPSWPSRFDLDQGGARQFPCAALSPRHGPDPQMRNDAMAHARQIAQWRPTARSRDPPDQCQPRLQDGVQPRRATPRRRFSKPSSREAAQFKVTSPGSPCLSSTMQRDGSSKDKSSAFNLGVTRWMKTID